VLVLDVLDDGVPAVECQSSRRLVEAALTIGHC
jgi:hypothetical protein